MSYISTIIAENSIVHQFTEEELPVPSIDHWHIPTWIGLETTQHEPEFCAKFSSLLCIPISVCIIINPILGWCLCLEWLSYLFSATSSFKPIFSHFSRTRCLSVWSRQFSLQFSVSQPSKRSTTRGRLRAIKQQPHLFFWIPLSAVCCSIGVCCWHPCLQPQLYLHQVLYFRCCFRACCWTRRSVGEL